MTNAVSDLFRLISQTDMRQDVLLTRLTEYISKVNAENTRMQVEKMEETNKNLRAFSESVAQLQGELSREQLQKLQETNVALQSLNETMIGMQKQMNHVIQQSVHAMIKSEVTDLFTDMTENRLRKKLYASENESNELHLNRDHE